MKSFFFVPGTKCNNLSMIQSLGVDEIIIDLEDAVKRSEREGLIATLVNSSNSKNYWIRIPVRDTFEQKINLDLLINLLNSGYIKFVLPKLKSHAELDQLLSIKEIKERGVNLLLLVEHPLLLLELENILLNYKSSIIGVGLGSHDLMSLMGGKHTLKNLEYPRQKILYAAKAAEIDAIDIASMELQQKPVFEEELKDGFEKGFDGKFLIHPWQLNLFNSFNYFTKEEVHWAKRVLDAYNAAGNMAEFAPIVINNEVIERPHLKRAKLIIQKDKNHDSE